MSDAYRIRMQRTQGCEGRVFVIALWSGRSAQHVAWYGQIDALSYLPDYWLRLGHTQFPGPRAWAVGLHAKSSLPQKAAQLHTTSN